MIREMLVSSDVWCVNASIAYNNKTSWFTPLTDWPDVYLETSSLMFGCGSGYGCTHSESGQDGPWFSGVPRRPAVINRPIPFIGQKDRVSRIIECCIKDKPSYDT